MPLAPIDSTNANDRDSPPVCAGCSRPPIQHPIDDVAEFAIVFTPDVLEHADGHEGVAAPPDIAVVVFDELHAVPHSHGAGARPGPGHLLARDVESPHPHAEAGRHVQGQRPHPQPASTTVSPGRSLSLAQMWSILAICASASGVPGYGK